MRQADGNPIQELSLDLRDVVKHHAEPNITLDDVNISWLNSDDFIKAFCNDCGYLSTWSSTCISMDQTKQLNTITSKQLLLVTVGLSFMQGIS